jgi:hypothetical protein
MARRVDVHTIIRQGAELADPKTGLAHEQQSLVEDPVRPLQSSLQLEIDGRWEWPRQVGRKLGKILAANQGLGIEAGYASLEQPAQVHPNPDDHAPARADVVATTMEGLKPTFDVPSVEVA